MPSETPPSREVLDHIREHDYDGQGKSFWKESADSTFLVGAFVMLLALFVIVLTTVLVILH